MLRAPYRSSLLSFFSLALASGVWAQSAPTTSVNEGALSVKTARGAAVFVDGKPLPISAYNFSHHLLRVPVASFGARASEEHEARVRVARDWLNDQ